MREPVEIPYRPDEKAMEPVRATKGAAGWDLYTAEDVVLYPFRAIIVPTGIKAALPVGSTLLILPRSGYSIKNQIVMPNSVGVIDEDYRGGIGISMMWVPEPTSLLRFEPSWEDPSKITFTWDQTATFRIPKFTRIAQAVLVPYLEQDWRKVDALPETARGTGGFGHTGVGTHDARAFGDANKIS